MTSVQLVDKKKKADDELEKIINELKAIDEDLNTRFDNIKKVLRIKRFIMWLFTSYSLENFETQIKSYKIVFEEIYTTIDEGKKENKSSSEIISELVKKNLDVEYKDKKAQIEGSNTLEKLHLSAGKMAKGLEATIANCRNNTLDDHNSELKNKLIVTQDVLDETLKENKIVKKEKEDLVKQMQVKDKQIQTQDKQIQAKDKQIQAKDRQIQKLEAENTEVKEQFQLVLQKIDRFEGMLAAMMSQSSEFKQFNNPNSPSSSLSDSDIEMIDVPSRKQ
ncbi:MAG: hypothetical protein U0X86_000264 [Wolbachia endosymbiont of Xenopsylla cheopis]